MSGRREARKLWQKERRRNDENEEKLENTLEEITLEEIRTKIATMLKIWSDTALLRSFANGFTPERTNDPFLDRTNSAIPKKI